MILEAHTERAERAHNERAWLAWHIALLGRVKKVPPLSKLLHRKGAKRTQQTPAQMLAIARMWTAAMGGEDRTRKTVN